jgi:hypothetical protein
MAIAKQAEQVLEARGGNAFGRVRKTEMVDNEGGRTGPD